jgi:chaperonin GroEL
MNIDRDFVFQDDCRNKIFKGIEKMYDAVSATLGPHGRIVMIHRGGMLVDPTKDGVTVADEVMTTDKWEKMGCQIVREASQKTNTEAGDGTTTAIVLAYNMCKEGLKAIRGNANVYKIEKGMKKAITACVDHLEKIKTDVSTKKDFQRVAAISTQDEDIGKIIANTFVEAGEHGSIEIERWDDPKIESERTEGMSFDKGWDSGLGFGSYVNDERNRRAVQEDVPVLVVDKKIERQSQLAPIMQKLMDKGIPRLFVMSDDFGGDALGIMVINNQRHTFHLTYVKAPSYGGHKIAIMKDVCALTGATFISEEHGGLRIEKAGLDHLGKAKKITIEKDRTIIVADDNIQNKKSISDRIDFLKGQLEDTPLDHIDRPEFETRLATLTDGISVLKVGATSEAERHEVKRRVEDGVKAVKSAREEGVTPGGGVALLDCIQALPELEGDEQVGVEIVKKSLKSIALKVLEVAYVEDKELLVSQMGGTKGYNFKSGKLGDMMKLGIFDAKKAVRIALESAASVSMVFLKADVAIADAEGDASLIDKVKDRFKG